MKRLVLGTRASPLALAQVELTRRALLAAFPEMEVAVETFVTRGDRKLDLNLLQKGDGGVKGCLPGNWRRHCWTGASMWQCTASRIFRDTIRPGSRYLRCFNARPQATC